MTRTKNTARKTSSGLLWARFTPTGDREYHGLKLKLLRNQIASDSEESPMNEEKWKNLTPTLERRTSPIVERTVAQWNTEYKQALAPRNLEELDTLVQDLRNNPPTPPAALAHPAAETAKEQEPAPWDPDKELPTPIDSTPTVFTETVAETPRQPLLLAGRATAVLSTPTPAVKCPRPEFRKRPRMGQPVKRTTSLSALQEIRHLQTKVDPIIPLLPFLRLVRDIVWELGYFIY